MTLIRDHRGQLFQVAEEQKGAARTARDTVYGLLGACAIATATIVPGALITFQLSTLPLQIISAAVAAVVSVLALRRWITHCERLSVRELLLTDRCPSCFYDLSAVTPHEDGCTICPECGAAWRIASDARSPGQPDA